MKCLVFAPHPDDETIGLGGTILKRIKEGYEVGWVIVTHMGHNKYSDKTILKRKKQIDLVNKKYKFTKVFHLNYIVSELDAIPKIKIYDNVSKIIQSFKPTEVFLPHPSDAHSDHKVVFDVVSSSTKSFRFKSIKKILCYETLSETGYGLKIKNSYFEPNYYVDISKFLQKKIEISKIYKSEFKKHPFPRSTRSIISNALIRGAESGFKFAEAFELLRNLED